MYGWARALTIALIGLLIIYNLMHTDTITVRVRLLELVKWPILEKSAVEIWQKSVSNAKLKPSSLVVVNAVGREQIVKTIAHNLNIFVNDQSRNWECLILIYVDENKLSNQKLSILPEKCVFLRTHGSMWGTNLLLLNPIEMEPLFEHIFLLLDDMYLQSDGENALNLEEAASKMILNNIDIFSPRVYGSYYKHMYSDVEKEGNDCLHEVSFIEIFAAMYTMSAWRCMYSFFEPQNSGGWCYDLCTWKFCPGIRQVVDKTMYTYHLEIVTPTQLKGVFKNPKKTSNEGSFHICNKYDCRPETPHMKGNYIPMYNTC